MAGSVRTTFEAQGGCRNLPSGGAACPPPVQCNARAIGADQARGAAPWSRGPLKEL